VKQFDGMRISRDRPSRSIELGIPDYIAGIHAKFVPAGYPARLTPVTSQDTINALHPAENEEQRLLVKDKPYLSALAAMIWYMTTICPVICYPVTALCQIMHDPIIEGWTVLIDLISYAFHSRFYCLRYCANPDNIPSEFDGTPAQWSAFRKNFLLHGYVDASWKIPSIAGWIYLMFGGPIDWSTKLIKVICHSAAEAEMSAASILCKSLSYFRQLCSDCGIDIDGPIPIFIDNTAAIDITGKMGSSKRTQHFLRWQFYVRYMVQHLYTRLIYIGTKRQIADALTKIIDATLFYSFRKHLMHKSSNTFR